MRVTRIYQNQPLSIGQTLTLDDKASHHLLHVLRIKKDALLTLFNGQGGEYQASVTAVGKREITVIIQHFTAKGSESPLYLHLGQAISRGEKMDFTLQKAVELGVNEITPLFTQYSGVKLSEERIDKRLQHWQSIVISACEQSGRNTIPIVNAPCSLATWLPHHHCNIGLLLNPHEGQSLKEISCAQDKIALLIGSEGGLSDEEIALAKKHHFISIQLGPRILRTETAGLATISALQLLWGDLGSRGQK